MLRLKNCPRCKTGDIGVDRDHYGWYEYCVQCGYMHDLLDVVGSGQRQAGDMKAARMRIRISGKRGSRK